ncbi:MAG: adenylate kinase [Muribaculaceae bacterium]|nr:adenylate kinase [Muribaculaceae bacterium]
MINLILFGPPGSGKGTQSEKLIDKYGLFHISTGDVLRKQIAEGTELGKIADKYISAGQLIPDELMVDILRHHIESHPEAKNGVIFDGFPRTIPQAEALKNMMEDFSSEIHAVIGLEVEDDELMERLIKRGIDSGRSDDNPETIRKRLDVYHSSTQPLKEYYTKSGHYRKIKGSGSVNEIFNEISSHVDPIVKK